MIKPTSYRPELDGVRAVCILLTITNHMPGAPYFVNGSVGVDIFFALSGWLITHLLLSEREKTGRISVKAFYIRRIFRIVPLYLITVALYGLAVFAMLRLKNDTAELQDYLSALPWLLTFNAEYRPEWTGNIFGHAWTLGIEEKFYIVWPVLMAIAVSGRTRTLLVLPLLVGLWLVGDNTGHVIRGYVGLGFGTLLAVWAQRETVKAFLGSPLNVYGSLVLIIGAYVGSKVEPTNAWNIAISLLSAFFIAGLWTNRETFVGKALAFSPLAFAGKLTYAIYLTHVLVLNVVLMALQRLGGFQNYALKFLIVYVFCFAVAYVLHRLIEKPLTDFGRELSTRGHRELPA